jgi:protein tyrosine phosphatase
LKNRYRDILPYPFNTARINGNPTVFGFDNCDTYINASIMHINGPGSETNVFGNGSIIITAQCPIPGTIHDFLQMLKQYEVKRVIMLTGLIENNIMKCDNYLGNVVNRQPILRDGNGTVITKFSINNDNTINKVRQTPDLSPAAAVGGRRLTRKSRNKSHQKTHKSKHTRKAHKSKPKRRTKKH